MEREIKRVRWSETGGGDAQSTWFGFGGKRTKGGSGGEVKEQERGAVETEERSQNNADLSLSHGSCHYFRVDALIITAGRCNLISDCHPSLAGPLCPLLPHLLLRLAATTAGKPLVSVARCGHWQKTVVVVVEQSAAEDGRGVVFGRTTGREVWRRKKSGVGEGRRREVGRGGGRGEVKKRSERSHLFT